MAGVKNITSVRGLARMVNRTHGAVSEWFRRSDWPFATVPPWPVSVVPEIEQWMDDHLEPDRNRRQRRVSAGKAKVAAGAAGGKPQFLGRYALKVDEVMGDPACPLYVAKVFGDHAGALTLDQVRDFVNHVNFALCLRCYDVAKAESPGAEPKLPAFAAPAYWDRMWQKITRTPPEAKKTSDAINAVVHGWAEKNIPDPSRKGKAKR